MRFHTTNKGMSYTIPKEALRSLCDAIAYEECAKVMKRSIKSPEAVHAAAKALAPGLAEKLFNDTRWINEVAIAELKNFYLGIGYNCDEDEVDCCEQELEESAEEDFSPCDVDYSAPVNRAYNPYEDSLNDVDPTEEEMCGEPTEADLYGAPTEEEMSAFDVSPDEDFSFVEPEEDTTFSSDSDEEEGVLYE